MQYVFPDYYRQFSCIKGACKHNCCIGWEIDIDQDTAEYYKEVSGDFGERLRKNICFEETPYFVLGKDERCPFLNSGNLCDIIITLGEDKLCGICADHPRFKNELPDRIEVGLGLCCEAAARLVLGKKTPVSLVADSSNATDDEIVLLRDSIFEILQNRDKTLSNRIREMLEQCMAPSFSTDIAYWAQNLLSLERLQQDWTRLLEFLLNYSTVDFGDFNRYMLGRETEYEQIAVYLVYRHFANAPDMYEAAVRAAFAAWGVWLVYYIGAAVYSKTGEFTFEHQVEVARLFSSEIEYSDENFYEILDLLNDEP